MIGFISYGTKHVDDLVPEGVDKTMFCSNCGEQTLFVEYYGQKNFYLFGFSLGPIGDKKHYLKCSKCKKIIYINDKEINQLKRDKEDIKQAEVCFWKALEDDEELKDQIFGNKIKCVKCKETIRMGDIGKNEMEKEVTCLKCGHIFIVRKNI